MRPNPRLFSFVGGDFGDWHVTGDAVILGDPLPTVPHLSIESNGDVASGRKSVWTLQGVTSNTRYVTSDEKSDLTKVEPAIGRSEATLAVMIPLHKNDAWWTLTQEQRRDIFHRSSHHDTGLKALPAIARRLHHCRDLVTAEPFDFITWFEFAPEHLAVFNDLLASLRETEEWQYIDREYELRLER
ncbi:MAG: chlorite dismutase family protein [Planctomycetota bacterium]